MKGLADTFAGRDREVCDGAPPDGGKLTMLTTSGGMAIGAWFGGGGGGGGSGEDASR